MASRRILNHILATFTCSCWHRLLAATLIMLLLGACGTTRDTGGEEPRDIPEREVPEGSEDNTVSEEFQAVLNSSHSQLSDVFATAESEIPAVFRQESQQRDIGDPYQGYRVQLLSTRNVDSADSLANEFRFWAEEAFDDYVPKVYVLFRQPYYKVHVGNFQFHEQAMKLNQFIKQRYPDAWVVPDEVEPNLVPPRDIRFGNQNGRSQRP